MFIREINIKRENDYGYGTVNPKKPLIAKIKVEGEGIETTFVLSPEASQEVLRLVANQVAEAGRRTAQNLTAAVFDQGLALPKPEEAPLPPDVASDEIPF